MGKFSSLPSARLKTDIDRARTKARRTTRVEVLHELLDEFRDRILMLEAANNAASDKSVLIRLASKDDAIVRIAAGRAIAERIETLDFTEEEKKKISYSLVGSTDMETKRRLARRTNDQTILRILYGNNRKDQEICKLCLKRFSNMRCIEKFICNASADTLYAYGEAILTNQNLSGEMLLYYITASQKLSNRHIDLIRWHPCYDEHREEIEKLLSKKIQKLTYK